MVRFLLRMALESPVDGRADLEAAGAVNDEDALKDEEALGAVPTGRLIVGEKGLADKEALEDDEVLGADEELDEDEDEVLEVRDDDEDDAGSTTV